MFGQIPYIDIWLVLSAFENLANVITDRDLTFDAGCCFDCMCGYCRNGEEEEGGGGDSRVYPSQLITLKRDCCK